MTANNARLPYVPATWLESSTHVTRGTLKCAICDVPGDGLTFRPHLGEPLHLCAACIAAAGGMFRKETVAREVDRDGGSLFG